MGRSPKPEAGELAAAATALYKLVETLRLEHEEAAAAAGLTAAQAMFLLMIDSPMSMRQLAQRMGCDASNVTGIVDRLEAKGLVVRTADRADRRVKRIARTAAGKTAVERFQRQLVRGSSLAQLSAKGRGALLEVLAEVQRGAGER
jgi:MarR family transcriptional regulator, organic hydroperoxide resistance regulator